MTAITILRENEKSDRPTRYHAMTAHGNVQSVGTTAGEALDALTAQIAEAESNTLVIVQEMHPDRFFTEAQILRMRKLMRRSRNARIPLTSEEKTELQALIEAELLASVDRTAALADALGR